MHWWWFYYRNVFNVREKIKIVRDQELLIEKDCQGSGITDRKRIVRGQELLIDKRIVRGQELQIEVIGFQINLILLNLFEIESTLSVISDYYHQLWNEVIVVHVVFIFLWSFLNLSLTMIN